jgi:hypothetical protein
MGQNIFRSNEHSNFTNGNALGLRVSFSIKRRPNPYVVLHLHHGFD